MNAEEAQSDHRPKPLLRIPSERTEIGVTVGLFCPLHRVLGPSPFCSFLCLPDTALLSHHGLSHPGMTKSHPHPAVSPEPWVPAHGTWVRNVTSGGHRIERSRVEQTYKAK